MIVLRGYLYLVDESIDSKILIISIHACSGKHYGDES